MKQVPQCDSRKAFIIALYTPDIKQVLYYRDYILRKQNLANLTTLAIWMEGFSFTNLEQFSLVSLAKYFWQRILFSEFPV